MDRPRIQLHQQRRARGLVAVRGALRRRHVQLEVVILAAPSSELELIERDEAGWPIYFFRAAGILILRGLGLSASFPPAGKGLRALVGTACLV